MTPLRVLVVEDSTTVRRYLCDVLAADPDIDVIAEATDGREAIQLCQTLRPDVVTMDMVLPAVSGLSATEHIMAHCPTPILIVSSSTNRGELVQTYDALAAGAIDVLDKPREDEASEAWEKKLRSTVKLVSRVRVVTHIRGRLGALAQHRPSVEVVYAPPASVAAEAGAFDVVAIGASTGGPGALLQLLRALPRDFDLPLLLVLHINEPFAAGFAEWLAGQTGFRVDYAVDGEPLRALRGRVTMAPPERHLVVRNGRVQLTRDPERHSCRPSIDELFESLASDRGASTAACLLTGMGRDGAAGLLAIRRAGGLTIAQDEATCVVYGMTREAVRLGAAERVLPLTGIGPAIAAVTRRSRIGDER